MASTVLSRPLVRLARTPAAIALALGVLMGSTFTAGPAFALPSDICEKADPLYHKGDYPGYLAELKTQAESGDANCQFKLGTVLRDGVLTKQNLGGAREWYLKAAEQNHPFAEFELGTMYDNGQGVPQDYAEAAKWYTKSGDQGFAMALRNLAVLYDEGQGVPKDKAKAKALYDQAEESPVGVDWLPK